MTSPCRPASVPRTMPRSMIDVGSMATLPLTNAPAAVAAGGLPRELLPLWAAGLVAGLLLFVRGLAAYRLGSRVATIATSSLGGLAAGEVRASGTVIAGPTTLVSPLQSARCVHYGSRVTVEDGRSTQVLLRDARSVSFGLRDGTGTVWVFPRDARWELEPRFDARSGLDDEPAGLQINRGAAEAPGVEDREAQIARLLTVQGAPDPDESLFARTMGFGGGPAWSAGDGQSSGGLASGLDLSSGGLSGLLSGDLGSLGGGRHYVEERVEPGDVVTIVATAMPFSRVGDGATDEDADPLDDPEIAGDLAAATAAGTLRARAEDAWGNAAIPGFGIGHPTRAPVLDPAATPEPVTPAAPVGTSGVAAATAAASGDVSSAPMTAMTAVAGAVREAGVADVASTATALPGEVPVALPLEIGPDDLVLATGTTGMTVFAGTPVEAAGSEMSRFWQGLAGAVLAVACAALLVIQMGAG
jgi:hypothetical protein